MEAGDHRGLSRAYIAREAAAFYGSHYEQAIRSCEEAIVHYGEVGYTPLPQAWPWQALSCSGRPRSERRSRVAKN